MAENKKELYEKFLNERLSSNKESNGLSVKPKEKITITKRRGKSPTGFTVKGRALGGAAVSREVIEKSLKGNTIGEKIINAIK